MQSHLTVRTGRVKPKKRLLTNRQTGGAVQSSSSEVIDLSQDLSREASPDVAPGVLAHNAQPVNRLVIK